MSVAVKNAAGVIFISQESEANTLPAYCPRKLRAKRNFLRNREFLVRK
jgi:hypothetical protein